MENSHKPNWFRSDPSGYDVGSGVEAKAWACKIPSGWFEDVRFASTMAVEIVQAAAALIESSKAPKGAN